MLQIKLAKVYKLMDNVGRHFRVWLIEPYSEEKYSLHKDAVLRYVESQLKPGEEVRTVVYNPIFENWAINTVLLGYKRVVV